MSRSTPQHNTIAFDNLIKYNYCFKKNDSDSRKKKWTLLFVAGFKNSFYLKNNLINIGLYLRSLI